MFNFFVGFFSKSKFMPHGHCYLWKSEILWLHLISDLVIAISYFSIPLMLYYFIYKRKNIPHRWIFKLFAAFIMWCGLTHIISIWTIWDPIYQIEGLAKAVTALVSALTAICLVPILPKLLALKGPEESEKLNEQLQKILDEKSKAEKELIKVNENLEQEIDERTRELVQYSSRLQMANSELESFAYQASHDLKSPLSSIMGLFEEIKRPPVTLEKYQAYLPKFEKNFKRLNSLITDILDLSKIGVTEKAWVALSDIIEEAKANVFHMIENTNAKIYIDGTFDIYCNKEQMISVFQNLLENSIKYTTKDQFIEIIISSQKKENCWEFEVKDNGIGINENNFESIFKPFFRGHSGNDYPGTGLGLSICKKIIVNHGGSIEVSSTEGEGTSFKFSIGKISQEGDK